MREIKFRAWDNNGKMWYPETKSDDNHDTYFVFLTRGIMWGLYGSGLENRIVSGEYGVIMQYTGLKDKNDKEIYEGDITLFAFDKIEVKRYRQILFENGCFIAVQLTEQGRRVLSTCFGRDGDPSDYEIVGNIYENPELITSKQLANE